MNNLKGNTKKVESVDLKRLFASNELGIQSLEKVCISRHLSNLSYVLTPNEYTLFMFLIGMAKKDNKIKYSTALLQQYDKATSRYMEICDIGKIHYSTSRDIARNSFISLIENGCLIRLNKNVFMINPMIIYPLGVKARDLQKEYLDIINGADVSINLTKWCNSI